MDTKSPARKLADINAWKRQQLLQALRRNEEQDVEELEQLVEDLFADDADADTGTRYCQLLAMATDFNSTTSLDVLKKIMTLFFNAMREESEAVIESRSEERAATLLDSVNRFLKRCHLRQTQCQKDEGPFPYYADLVSGIASLYLDLFLVAHGGDLAKKERRAMGHLVKQLLEESGEKAFDALLQVTAADVTNADVLSSLIRYFLRQQPAKDSPSHYLRYVMTVSMWQHLLFDLDDLVKTTRMLRAPKGFVAWLTELEPNLKKELPDDPKFKGQVVTYYILDDVKKDQDAFQLLSDAIANYSSQPPAATNLDENDLGALTTNKKKKKKKKKTAAAGITENGNSVPATLFTIDRGMDAQEEETATADAGEAKKKKKRKRKRAEEGTVGLLGISGDDKDHKATPSSSFDSGLFMIDRGDLTVGLNGTDATQEPKKKKKKKNVDSENTQQGGDGEPKKKKKKKTADSGNMEQGVVDTKMKKKKKNIDSEAMQQGGDGEKKLKKKKKKQQALEDGGAPESKKKKQQAVEDSCVPESKKKKKKQQVVEDSVPESKKKKKKKLKEIAEMKKTEKKKQEKQMLSADNQEEEKADLKNNDSEMVGTRSNTNSSPTKNENAPTHALFVIDRGMNGADDEELSKDSSVVSDSNGVPIDRSIKKENLQADSNTANKAAETVEKQTKKEQESDVEKRDAQKVEGIIVMEKDSDSEASLMIVTESDGSSINRSSRKDNMKTSSSPLTKLKEKATTASELPSSDVELTKDRKATNSAALSSGDDQSEKQRSPNKSVSDTNPDRRRTRGMSESLASTAVTSPARQLRTRTVSEKSDSEKSASSKADFKSPTRKKLGFSSPKPDTLTVGCFTSPLMENKSLFLSPPSHFLDINSNSPASKTPKKPKSQKSDVTLWEEQLQEVTVLDSSGGSQVSCPSSDSFVPNSVSESDSQNERPLIPDLSVHEKPKAVVIPRKRTRSSDSSTDLAQSLSAITIESSSESEKDGKTKRKRRTLTTLPTIAQEEEEVELSTPSSSRKQKESSTNKGKSPLSRSSQSNLVAQDEPSAGKGEGEVLVVVDSSENSADEISFKIKTEMSSMIKTPSPAGKTPSKAPKSTTPVARRTRARRSVVGATPSVSTPQKEGSVSDTSSKVDVPTPRKSGKARAVSSADDSVKEADTASSKADVATPRKSRKEKTSSADESGKNSSPSRTPSETSASENFTQLKSKDGVSPSKTRPDSPSKKESSRSPARSSEGETFTRLKEKNRREDWSKRDDSSSQTSQASPSRKTPTPKISEGETDPGSSTLTPKKKKRSPHSTPPIPLGEYEIETRSKTPLKGHNLRRGFPK